MHTSTGRLKHPEILIKADESAPISLTWSGGERRISAMTRGNVKLRISLESHASLCLCFQKEKEGSEKSLPQQNQDSDIWVPEYLAPSWLCLPNNQPVLVVVQPGETVLEVLRATCKVWKLLMLMQRLDSFKVLRGL